MVTFLQRRPVLAYIASRPADSKIHNPQKRARLTGSQSENLHVKHLRYHTSSVLVVLIISYVVTDKGLSTVRTSCQCLAKTVSPVLCVVLVLNISYPPVSLCRF